MFCCKKLTIHAAMVLVSACCIVCAAGSSSEYIVSTIAGGVAPTTPVAARNASIGSISGMTVDSSGNVYLSTSLHCVFKLDSAHILTRFAGTCRPGYTGDGGLAVNAQLRTPTGMAVDGKGSLYIADSHNEVVRKVSADGIITTIAGNGRLDTWGDGGPAIRAAVCNPRAVATDSAGNIYIAENNAIRRVSADGIITSLAGNGLPGLAADGRSPVKRLGVAASSLAVDSEGSLYYSDYLRYTVGRISRAGVITTVAGTGKSSYSGDGGPAASAQLSYPNSVAVDSAGNVYIADGRNFRIRKVSVGGTITTIAGNGTEGPAGDGGPAKNAAVTPRLLAVDTHGTIYVVGDAGAGRLRSISANGTISTVMENDYPERQKIAVRSRLYFPGDIAVDSAGNVFIAEDENRRIRKVDRRGRISTVAGCGTCDDLGDGGPATSAQIGAYFFMATDAKGNLYISEPDFHRVRKISSKGIITTIAGTGSAGFSGDGGPAVLAQLNMPRSIAVDSAGNLFIADAYNKRVRKVAIDGTISTVAGDGTTGPFRDGRPAVNVPLGSTFGSLGRVAVDPAGNVFFEDSGILRKVSAAGIISTLPIRPPTPGLSFSYAVDGAGSVYTATGSSVVSGTTISKLAEEGSLEPIAGTGESGYSGDGGPALKARFADVRGIAIDRSGRIYLSDVAGNAVRMLTPVKTAKEDTSDLNMELRSATGSNRFQVGAEIPLEVVLSSSTPNRYLEPCALFRESHFGFPQCRFFNRWYFSITSSSGWVDLTQEFPSGPGTVGGPTLKEPNPDLSTKAVTFSYVLTHRFRFDKPGEYRVRLAMDVGIDDETTQRKSMISTSIRPHKVSVVREIVLQIVPAAPGWSAEVIRKGIAAMNGLDQPVAHPPSPEALQRKEEAANALCTLGTPEAARALAGLLVNDDPNHQRAEGCLEHTASPGAAIEEMERLLVDPDAAINPGFFRVLVMLLGMNESRAVGLPMLSQTYVDKERGKLFAALAQKHGEAQITSLLTVVANPARAQGKAGEFGYNVPFATPVIAATVSNFDRLPAQSKQWLVDDGWDRVASPLMLPVVRKMATAGDGQALLRWLELDPPAARAFVQEEVVRPAPRFSSFYLRLPAESLPDQEARIASNFVALTDAGNLTRAATLLHRYATAAVLGAVLPFVDAKRAGWPCSVQVPVLAYLLKVSPSEAEPRVEKALSETNQGACRTNSFFTDIGFLEPSPVLDRLALAEIDKGPKSFASNAAEYLRRYGSSTVKPLLYARLVTWHQSYVDSGAEKRVKDGTATKDDNALRYLVQELAESFGRAQAWVLTPKESNELTALLGSETTGGISCQFSCRASLETDGEPGSYAIYGRANEKFERGQSPMDYLNPAERLHYSINQYRCEDMKDLKRKILQFPAGSTFGFTWDFTAADKDEIVEIAAFLRSHGYRLGGTNGWSFLQPDPPEASESGALR